MPNKEYTCLLNKGGTIPFGYRQDENDPELLVPDEHELAALKAAVKAARNGASPTEVLRWFYNETGREMSRMTLWRLRQSDPTRGEELYED